MTDQALATKHLDLLQGAITRLAGNAFLIKGWNVTLATAITGFAVKDGAAAVALVGLVPVALLWALDAYYLSLEQDFRRLFDEAKQRLVAQSPPTLDMSPSVTAGAVLGNAFRFAVVLVHLPMLLLVAAVGLGSVGTGP